jgi:hypothetical protein
MDDELEQDDKSPETNRSEASVPDGGPPHETSESEGELNEREPKRRQADTSTQGEPSEPFHHVEPIELPGEVTASGIASSNAEPGEMPREERAVDEVREVVEDAAPRPLPGDSQQHAGTPGLAYAAPGPSHPDAADEAHSTTAAAIHAATDEGGSKSTVAAQLKPAPPSPGAELPAQSTSEPVLDQPAAQTEEPAPIQVRVLPNLYGNETGSGFAQLGDDAFESPSSDFGPIGSADQRFGALARAEASAGKERIEVQVEVSVAKLDQIHRQTLDGAKIEIAKHVDEQLDEIRLQMFTDAARWRAIHW